MDRTRAAGRGDRAMEHRRLDPRPRPRLAARGTAAAAAAAAPALRGRPGPRARPALRHRARRVLGIRQRASHRRPGARAGLRQLRAPHLVLCGGRDRRARRRARTSSGVALADGWWAGRLGLTGSSAQFGTRTSAIWQLHIDYADGTTQVVASGADVRSATGPGRTPTCSSASGSTAVPSRRDGAAPDSTTASGCRWPRSAPTTAARPFRGEPVRRVLELARRRARRDRGRHDRGLRPGARRTPAAAPARHGAGSGDRARAHRDARRRRLVVREHRGHQQGADRRLRRRGGRRRVGAGVHVPRLPVRAGSAG